MEKQKIFWILITIGVSVVILATIILLVFNSDEVNEGKFRVSDIILSSTVDITNKTEQNKVWSIDLSQKNKLSILITAAHGASINKIYLSDVTSSKNNITFSQLDNENKLILDRIKRDLEIEYTIDGNDQILLEFVAINENILKNWIVPEEVKQIVYDGRVLNTANISFNEIKFNLRFKLNIVENNGKINTMNVELTLPNKKLVESGADVRRLALSDFVFKVK